MNIGTRIVIVALALVACGCGFPTFIFSGNCNPFLDSGIPGMPAQGACGVASDAGEASMCTGDTMADPSNCGACGNACPSGDVCVAGACVPGPPRQIAPLSTATVTSQQPAFHWTLPGGGDSAQVDICRDRGCATIVTSFMASGMTGAPTSPLAHGLYYWRVHRVSGGVVAPATSAVWEFWVGARSASVNTSWGTTLDVNGDGYADVVASAPGASSGGVVNVYMGGHRDPRPIPQLR